MTSMASEAHILLPYQRRWVEDRSPRKIWLASRQVGKSFALSLEAVNEALSHRCDNLLLASSERQSRELMRKVRLHLRALNEMVEGFSPSSERAEEVEFRNGSRVISLPANPDTVRGFSGNVFLDEFAFHSDDREVWRAMYPSVTRGYKVRICSTPNGRGNLFYELWSRGSQEQGSTFTRHRTDIHAAVKEGLKADIKGLRESVGDADAWAQEFECRFLDGATAYIPYGMISSVEDAGATMEADRLDPSGEYYLGVDVGRTRDLTVMWLLERVGDVLWTRQIRQMRRAPFALQRDALYSLLEEKSLRRAALDSTGIGAQLAEEAQARYRGRVEPVHFSAGTKEDMAVTLRRAFEDRAIRIPSTPEIREDIHSVIRSVTSAGNLLFDAACSEPGHSDRFWALVLGVYAATLPAGQRVAYESLGVREHASSRGCF